MRLRRDVRDWVVKVEEDFAVVQVLARRRRPAVQNAVCFHAQQCAKKYLKALEYLEPYAVNLRYPGERATRAEAQRSARAITQVREALRRLLGCS